MTSTVHEFLPYLPNLIISHSINSDTFPDTSDEETFEAVTFFADITGFTPLAEKMATRGPQGVETLSRLINDFFQKLIDKVMDHGGDVVNLAGDGLLAIWKTNDHSQLTSFCHLAVQCAHSAQTELHNYETSTGEKLSMRIGIGLGDAHAFYIKTTNGRWEYLITGEAVKQAHISEGHASPGEIILSDDVWNHITQSPNDYQADQIQSSQTHFLLASAPKLNQPLTAGKPLISEEKGLALRGFLPLTVSTRLIAGQGDWIGELRRTSVLFVNLKKINNLSPLDEIANVIQAIDEIVHHYEGTINKVGMDEKGITPMVIFGLPPFVHEDDTVRTVLAAQEISKKLSEINQPHGIGITTGRIFSGAIGSSRRREYVTIGDMVNTSARLMQATLSQNYTIPILCDSNTQQVAGSKVNLTPLEPIQVKGKNEPIPIFQPTESATHHQAKHRVAAFVGRTRELQVLHEALSTLSEADARHVVVIEGEAGIGKSYLLGNFQAELNKTGKRFFASSADSIEKNTSYFCWRNIFHQLFDLETHNEVKSRKEHILSHLPEKWHERVALLNPILGLDFDEPYFIKEMSAEVRAENTRGILLDLLQATTSKAPLIITIEDAQWLDSASWALILQAANSIAPFLLIISTRPSIERTPPDLRRLLSNPQTQHLVLGPLPKEDTFELVKQRLGVESLPLDITDLIWNKADGNPFFSEELAYSLRDSKLIEIDGKNCRIAPNVNLGTFTFPDTVHGIVSSRIDRLPPQEQLCIKVASAIGRIFTYRILHDIHPIEVDREQLRSYLEELEKLDLTPLEAPDPELAYIFKHAITQDVAYNLMLFSQRRELHKSIADWHEQHYANDLSSFYTVLAHHWQHAGDEKKALHYLEAAAQQALDTFANHEAINFLKAVIQIDKKSNIADKFQKARWQRQLGQAHKGLGDMKTSETHLKNALRLMGYPMPVNQVGWILELIGQFLRRTFIPPKDKSSKPKEIEHIKEAELAYEHLSEIYYFASDLPPFLATLLRLLNLVDAIGPSSEMARMYGAGTLVSGLIPLHGIAKRYEEHCRKLVEQLGHFEGLAYTMFSISLYNLGVGNFERAKADMERAVESVMFLNNRPRMAEVFTVMAQVFQRLGQYEESFDFFERSYQTGIRGENPQHQAWGLNGKAGILLYQGRKDHAKDAIALLNQSLPLLAGSTDHTEDIRAYGMLGIAYLRNNQPDEARKSAEMGLHFISTTSPTAHDSLEGCAGIAETYLTLLETTPKDKELSKLANKALKGFFKYGQVFPIFMPRYWCYKGWYEWVQNKPDHAQKSWQKSVDEARKFNIHYEEARAIWERSRLTSNGNDLQTALEIFKQLGTEYEIDQIVKSTLYTK